MNKRWFTFQGILVLLACLPIIYYYIEGFNETLSSDEIIFYIVMSLILVIVISLGIYFIRIGNEDEKKSGIQKASLFVSGFGFLFLLSNVLLLFAPPGNKAFLFPVVTYVAFLPFQIIASILLVIRYFVNKTKV